MKKVITICLLVATLFVGGITADAKTTKKNTKARTTQTGKKGGSLSVDTFLKCENSQYKLYWYKDLSKIKAALKDLGYKDIGEEDGGYYESEDGEMAPMVTTGFQKGSTEVYIYRDENYDFIRYIGIKFGSSTEKSNFLKAANNKSKGTNISVWQEDGMVCIAALEN